MDHPAVQEKPKGRGKRLINLLLLFAILGGILACFGTWFFTSKFTSQWRELESAPPGSVKIVGGGFFDVYVQNQDGQVYSGDPFIEEARWIPDVVPVNHPKIEPCDQSRAAFLFYLNPPVDMISCIQFYYVDAHFVGTLMFALTKDGNIWEWQHGSMEYGFLLYPIALLGGAAAGLLLGSLIWIATRIFRKRYAGEMLIPRD
jgi:hypothetical protein